MDLKEKILKFLEISYLDFIGFLLFSLLIFIFYWTNNLLGYVGIFISITGFFIWVLGRIYLGKSFKIIAKAKKLVTTGIYSKLRHPIYFGGFLVIFGTIIFTIGENINIHLIIIIILYIIFQVIRIISEEKALEEKFGKKYLKYKESSWF
ncbi:MAG: isoprenylcysteine carboxylmethyltransferase family protein [Candidatus Pacearchaeota archaeon]|nr:isoprenylcysteine carboxylmethyltransferase family protein [Candidatus Pacearchaeota archaeon]